MRHDITANDASFSGSNATFNAVVTYPNAVVAAQAKIKLSSAETADDAGIAASWEKAYVGFDLPAYSALRLWGGHGMPLYLAGAYITQLDLITAGARWVKDGIAVQWHSNAVSFSAGMTATTTTHKFSDGVQAGSGLQLDFAHYGLPLQLGATLVLDTYAAGSNDHSIEARSWTSAVFAQYKPSRAFTTAAGYTTNGAPVTTNATFGYVEFYNKSANNADLQHSHLITLNATARLAALTVAGEAEGGASFDGGYRSLYTGLRVTVPVATLIKLQPAVQYFGIYGDNREKDRDCLVLYPRVVVEQGQHQFMLGAKIEHREMTSDSYHWIVKIPAYYRYTLP